MRIELVFPAGEAGVLPIDERAFFSPVGVVSSTGGIRTRSREGLSFAAVPIRVPCQRCFAVRILFLFLASPRLTLKSRLRTPSTATVFEPALGVHPLGHCGRFVEGPFPAVGKSDGEFLFCFHRVVSEVARVGFEPTGTKV